MRLLTALCASMLFLPTVSFAAPLNAGLVQGIWYAHEPLFADVPNRIYVAFRNTTESDLTGSIHFFVDAKDIGSSEVHALAGGVVETWIDWTPSYGNHTVTATIGTATLTTVGGETKTVSLTGLSATSTSSVDRDTDKDGIGDAEDSDDDNDAVSDSDEQARGTNPLVPDAHPQEKSEEKSQTPINGSGDASSSSPTGLERFIPEGAPHSTLETITHTINTAHQAVETYRTERNAKIHDALIPESTSDDGVSITRTSIEDAQGSLSKKVVLGAKAILSHLWTATLALVSLILHYPALVEIGSLLLILYILFRTARRLGRRPSV